MERETGEASWVAARGFARRPLVVVEDHLHHVGEVLAALAQADPEAPALATVLCLDRPGPDTDRAVERWLATYPMLQVAAPVAPTASAPRLAALPPELFTSAPRFARTVAGMLRPGGLLLQDIQLSTLRFLPGDRWWESIYLANTVRGMFAHHPPACCFFSNKRGYEATFGRDLLEAGFHPRDVMDKGEIEATVVPVVLAHLARAFPWRLRTPPAADGPDLPVAVAPTDEDREEIEAVLDLVLWSTGSGIELGGRRVQPEGGRRLALKAGSQEALTWMQLFDDRWAADGGVPVLAVGERVAPEGAGRAERTNLAARHLHGLRARLVDGGAIVTAHHAYRLAAGLRVGRVGVRQD